jgi:hypothetical protein
LDPDATSRRCSTILEILSRLMSTSKQVAASKQSLSSSASAEANVRSAAN